MDATVSRSPQNVAETDATQLSRIAAERLPELVDHWLALGSTGPTFGSPDAGPPEVVRERYLRPLARLLVGGLRGSHDHAAVYLDERLRYAEPTLTPEAGRELLTANLVVEIAGIAELLKDSIDPVITTNVLTDFHALLTHTRAPKLKVLFIGDCLFVETRAFLVPQMLRRGCPIDISHVFFSAGQQVEHMNDAAVTEVQRSRPDIVGISLFTFEGIPLYRAAWRSAASFIPSRREESLVEALVGTLHSLIEDIRAVSQATIVIHAPGGLPLDPVRRRIPLLAPHSRAQRELTAHLGKRITELAENTINVIRLDESNIIARGGGLRPMSRPLFDTDDVPEGYAHTTRVGSHIAAAYGAVLADYDLLGAAKVLLVDFDNTLWRGVMGDGFVEHDVDRQRLLKGLQSAGVLLVAVSKNDPNLIRWDEMALDETDFALTKINWRPKADNVREAIIELDLAPSAFVMIDDNPVERTLVEEQVPGVRTLDATDENSWRRLRNWLRFPSTAQTDEASRRTKMYREAAGRKAALTNVGDYGAMMRSLNLRYSVRLAKMRDTDRIMELVQRTNQFNTTTHRRTVAEVQDIIRSEDVGVYVASLSDRFGDLGIVGIVVFERESQLFESVIMSCRAMGFGLEIALLRAVMDSESEPGPYHGLFFRTERNKPAADLFERAGFKRDGDDRWVLAEGRDRPMVPEWLKRS